MIARRLVALAVEQLQAGDLPRARLLARDAAVAAVAEPDALDVACRLNQSLGELCAVVAVVEFSPDGRAQLNLFEVVA